jgi:hypothetical protein
MATTADFKKTTRCWRCCVFLKTTGNNAAGTTACLNSVFSSLFVADKSMQRAEMPSECYLVEQRLKTTEVRHFYMSIVL